MNVTRDVIVDLLPLYLAGEASAGSRALVEEYLAQDPELARRLRDQWSESLARVAPSALRPELALRSLRRTRRVLGWQRWLFGLGIGFWALAMSVEFSIGGGKPTQAHFLMRDHPVLMGTFLLVGLACWIAYFTARRRLRTGRA